MISLQRQITSSCISSIRISSANSTKVALLIAAEDVAGIDLGLHVVEGGVVAVGDDGGGLLLEGGEVVDDAAAEEGVAVGEGGLVDDDRGALGLDALHDALDGALAEIVGVALHRQTIDADGDGLARTVILVLRTVVVPAGLAQHGVGDVVLARAVALDDGGHHVLRHVLVVGEQLFGVLGQAVAAVAERGVVVVGADAGVEADALNDGAGVEALDFGIGIEFVEVADAEGEVGVGEEFDGLGFLHAHKQGVDVFLEGAFLQQAGEEAGVGFGVGVADGGDGGVLFVKFLAFNLFGTAHDDAAGVEVVVEGLALAEKLGREEEVEVLALEVGIEEELQGVALVERAGVTHGDGALDDHHGVGVDAEDEVDDVLDVVGVEEVFDGVVVCRRGDDDEVGIAVGGGAVEGGGEVEVLLGEVFLDIFVLDGRNAAVDLLHLFGDDIDGRHPVVLRQQRGDAQTDIARTGYGDFQILVFSHSDRFI